jgi:hypothetical protein
VPDLKCNSYCPQCQCNECPVIEGLREQVASLQSVIEKMSIEDKEESE